MKSDRRSSTKINEKMGGWTCRNGRAAVIAVMENRIKRVKLTEKGKRTAKDSELRGLEFLAAPSPSSLAWRRQWVKILWLGILFGKCGKRIMKRHSREQLKMTVGPG